MQYTIGEMAKLLDISPSTLRYYDQEGLLLDVRRSPGGIRIFEDKDIAALQIICCLKASGMRIADIRHFIRLVSIGDSSIDARLELFEHQKAEVEKQLAALQETLEIVKFKCWYYQTAKKAGSTSVPDSLPDSALPDDMRKVRSKLRQKRTMQTSPAQDT